MSNDRGRLIERLTWVEEKLAVAKRSILHYRRLIAEAELTGCSPQEAHRMLEDLEMVLKHTRSEHDKLRAQLAKIIWDDAQGSKSDDT